jgi:hypothetical protein
MVVNMKKELPVEDIISKSLTAARVQRDFAADIAWQERSPQVVDYLKEHITHYSPEDRRFLYVKSIELDHDAMISLLVHGLEHDRDGPALRIIETVLADKMTTDDAARYLTSSVHCESRLAQSIVEKLRRRLTK